MAEVQQANTDIYKSLQTPKGMSLGEMLGIQKSQYELSKLKELYPAMISGEQARSKTAQIGASEAEQLLDPNVAKGKAESKKAIVDLNQKELESLTAHSNSTISGIQKLFNKQNLTAEDIVKEATNLNKIHGGSQQALEKTLQGLPANGTKLDLQTWLAEQLASTTGSLSQLEKLYPAAQLTNLGGKVVPLAIGNPLLTGVAQGTQVGPAQSTSLPPQIFPHQITGAPQIFGGGGGGGVGQQPQVNLNQGGAIPSQSNVAPSQSNVAPNQGGGVTPAMMSQGSNQLQQGANESRENFNARVKVTQDAYVKALDQINNPSSKFGHIPTTIRINESIMDLLKDPTVNTGAVANAIANKTNKGISNVKEQELYKFLEQRIQAKGHSSDADADSKRKAFGDPSLKKEALMDLIRNEMIPVTIEDLATKGVRNNALINGTTANPNFGNIANFNSEFSRYANNTDLMRYISVVGENQKPKFNPKDPRQKEPLSEMSYINKTLGQKLNKSELENLEAQRQEIIKLINGGR